MRTKNLNLKKKIAFIASVAMIATTAAYLPAEVTQNIFNSTTVSAANEDQGSEQYINLFQAYVKVNGKYLANNTGAVTATNPATKLFASITAIENDANYQAVIVNDKLKTKTANANRYDDVFVTDTTTNAGTSDTVTLPYNTPAGATIAVEIVPYSKNTDGATAGQATLRGAITSSISEYEVTLDDHGFAEVAKNSKDVEVTGDTYVEPKTTPVVVAEAGDKEKVNFSGLKFKVDQAPASEGLGAPETVQITTGAGVGGFGVPGATVTIGAGTGVNCTLVDDPDAILANDNIKDYQYYKTASGNVYAKNMVTVLPEEVQPGDRIVVDLKLKNNWTATGTGVSSGKLTVSMGDNGYVSSGLITVANGADKEYYIFTIINKKSTIAANVDAFTLDGVAGEAGATALNALAGRVKVKSEPVSKTVNGKTEFVQVVTVSTNDATKDYSKTGFKVKLTGGNQNYQFLTAPTQDATTGLYFADSKRCAIDHKGNAVADPGVDTLVIKPAANTGANYTTPVIKFSDGTPAHTGYVQFVFTTKYQIPVYDTLENSATAIDPKKKLGYAEVDGLKVTKPAEPTKGGYTFDYWAINTTAAPATYTTKLFYADSDVQQLSDVAGSATSEGAITPNAKILAHYVENEFTVNYDANGGYYSATTLAVLKKDEFIVGGNAVDMSVQVQTDKLKASTDAAVLTETGAAIGAWGTVKKPGYEFKGWSSDPAATDKMTYEDYKKVRPTAKNGNVTLYAVWKAKEVAVKFGNLDFDTKGLSTSGTALGNFKASNALTDGVNINQNKAIIFKAGSAFGTLPEPTLRGYTFEGWYRQVKTKNSKNDDVYSAVKVTKDDIIETKYLDDVAEDMTLYAKFTQNSYKVTTDYNGGKLVWSKDIVADGATGNYKLNAGCAALTRAAAYNDVAHGLTAGATGTRITNLRISEKQYVEGPEEIATCRYNATSKSMMFFDADNSDITDYVDYMYEVRKGSGDYDVFEGYYINGDTTAIGIEDLNKTLSDYTTLSDLTLNTYYEATNETSEGSIYLESNDGTFYKATGNSFTAPGRYVAFPAFTGGVSAAKDTYISSKLTVNGANVKNESTGDYLVLARPGYTFTGWFADEACTTPYSFDGAKFEGGKEIKAYAGWKANSTTRYHLRYNLMNKNGSFVTYNANKEADMPGDKSDDVNFEFQNTFMGTTGTIVKSEINDATGKEREIEFNGKTYVLDKKLSADCNTEKELKAVFNANHVAANPAGGVAGIDGLDNGKFVLDPTEYTVIEGIFVEKGSESTDELGNVTNVKGTANGDKVTISFKAADNAVKYQVAKIVNGKTYYSAKTDATSIDITPASVDYQVYVIAFDKDGKSTHSETIKLTGVKKYNLGTVMDPVATEKLEADGTKTVTISWSKAENAAWYKVFKIVNGKKYWGKKVTDTSYVLKNIPATDSYIVYVAAGDDKGHVTYGARKKVSKFPSVTNVTLAPDKKTVTFDAAEGAVKYQVAKIEENNKVNYSAKSTTTSITLKNAFKAGQKYYVLAFFEKDGKTYSSYSDTFEVK